MEPTDDFEVEARRCGYRRVAGVDEAGRGPLAGPVVAAAVILPARCRLTGINDSKQLSESEREALYDAIIQRAIGIGVGIATEQEIDRLNILQATRTAMRRAIMELAVVPDCLLTDAMELPGVEIALRAIPSAGIYVPYRVTVPSTLGPAVMNAEAINITAANNTQIALRQ